MTVKLERPTSAEWHQEIVKFLSDSLQRPVSAGLLVPLAGSGFAHVFVKRIDGKPVAAQAWLTAPHPMADGERICYRLCAVGEHQDEIDTYRRAVFDTFPQGMREVVDD
jgi:hypothetical protein